MAGKESARALSREECDELIHELKIHQTELEIQNDELRRAQREMEDSRRRIADLYDYAPVGYFSLDRDGVVREANLAGTGMLHMDRERLIGMPLTRTISLKSRDAFRAHLNTVSRRGIEHVEDVEFTLLDGESFWGRLKSVPVRDAGENVTGIRTTVMDITERKRLEEQVARFGREQESFMRHELKNLVMPMRLFSELLIGDADNLTEMQTGYLKRIADGVERVFEFIDYLKKLHDIESGDYVLMKTKASLVEIIRRAIADLEPKAKKSDVTVRFSEPDEDAVTLLDAQLMPGVFFSLILNAIEHVEGLADPAEKRVTVEFTKESGFYVIRIHNRGAPIPPERLTTCFDKYNPGPEKLYGTGLGTTYANIVILSHGGKVAVSSNAEEGTAVTVRLPAE